MKKIALLLCAIVMFGCSDDEEKAGTEVPDPEISKCSVVRMMKKKQAQKFLTRK